MTDDATTEDVCFVCDSMLGGLARERCDRVTSFTAT